MCAFSGDRQTSWAWSALNCHIEAAVLFSMLEFQGRTHRDYVLSAPSGAENVRSRGLSKFQGLTQPGYVLSPILGLKTDRLGALAQRRGEATVATRDIGFPEAEARAKRTH